MSNRVVWILSAALAAGAGTVVAWQGGQPAPPHEGFEDTPYLPGQPWRAHDIKRPLPRVITPGTASTQAEAGKPPSDAVVLFDGKDLSKWVHVRDGRETPPRWTLRDGYAEVVDGTGDLVSKEKFGDAQYHVEWMAPPVVQSTGQGRGNSGVLIMSRYEIQVLDVYNNPTYADGYTGAIYGQWPPLVAVPRPPGQWQVYDILFEAPRFENGKLVRPAYATVLLNGIVLHHHKEIMGRMVYRAVATYAPHAAEEPLALQEHHNPVRYRSVWVRRLGGYDQP